MKISFLGTGASPSSPLPFCSCDFCIISRTKGGKNNRKRSSVLVNDDLLIDIGPDIYSASAQHGISLDNVKICLQTHSHEDHFDPEWIIARHPEYAATIEHELSIMASNETLMSMDRIIRNRCDYGSIFDAEAQKKYRIGLTPIRAYERLTIDRYVITAYPANHGSGDQGFMLYSIHHGGKSLLYATDTSVFFEEVWHKMREYNERFDMIVIDHTYGAEIEPKPGDHLSLKGVAEHIRRFRQEGLINPNGAVYATHISHEGNAVHDEFEKLAEKLGYRVAFDGLQVEL